MQPQNNYELSVTFKANSLIGLKDQMEAAINGLESGLEMAPKKPLKAPKKKDDSEEFNLDDEETAPEASDTPPVENGDDDAQTGGEDSPEDDSGEEPEDVPISKKKQKTPVKKPPIPPLKTLKTISGKVTKETVITELKKLANGKGRDKAYAILKKFKVKSVNDLKSDQYSEVMKAIKAAS